MQDIILLIFLEQGGMLSLLSSMKKHSVRKTGVTASRVEADSGNRNHN